MNPIMQMMSGNNPVGMILQALDGGMNPQATAAQIMQQNPQAAAAAKVKSLGMGTVQAVPCLTRRAYYGQL